MFIYSISVKLVHNSSPLQIIIAGFFRFLLVLCTHRKLFVYTLLPSSLALAGSIQPRHYLTKVRFSAITSKKKDRYICLFAYICPYVHTKATKPSAPAKAVVISSNVFPAFSKRYSTTSCRSSAVRLIVVLRLLILAASPHVHAWLLLALSSVFAYPYLSLLVC